jgi:N-acetylmuramoyl-L-alanine amidase
MVGYHYFIRKDGLLQYGRPLEMMGAHCEGHNKNSVGICLSGRHEFFKTQFKCLADLVDSLRVMYTVSAEEIYAHNQLDKHGKTCPNFDISFLKKNLFNREE